MARLAGPWAPVGFIILFAVGALAFVPGAIFSLAGGALFGPFWGSVWNLLGATLGATLAFLVPRYVAGDWVEQKAGGLLKRLIDGVDAEGWRRRLPGVPRVDANPDATRCLAHLGGGRETGPYLARL